MTTANRIRVLIAGNVYVKRTLVRRFLEDDGYEVVGDVMAADAVVPGIRAGRPDAVVLDEDLTAHGASIVAIREAAPDVRVIVFTAATPGAGAPPPGADGYLDKGVGLSALTALLGRLFAEPTGALEPLLVGAGVGATSIGDTPGGSMEDTRKIEPKPAGGRAGGPGGNVYRIVAMVAGALLIVWGVFAAIEQNDDGAATATVAEASPTPGGGEVISEPGTTSVLDEAYATLDRMIEALKGGNYILATVEAQTLMDQREQATSAGFALVGLDAEITTRLQPIVPSLPERINVQLADILGSLYPPFETQTQTKPDTGTQVLGTTVTNDGGTSSGTDSSGTDTTGGGGGGGQTEPAPQPGDGRVWGQSHKPPHGGWHGQKPK